MAQTNNPPISTVLKIFTAVEFVVLATVSTVLFFFPTLGHSVWAWEIGAFNICFLGAVYFASAVAVGCMLFIGRWAPARVILPMLFTFTFVVLLVSIWKSSTFFFDRPATWGWFFLYIVLPIDAFIHLILYRKLKPADQNKTSPAWRAGAILLAVLFVIYGLGELIAPATFTSFWPWKMDAFHTQLYSGIFFTAAVGLYLVSKTSARVEFLSLGLTLAVCGFFSLLGVTLANAQLGKVDWSAGGTVAWLIGYSVILLTGLGMILASRRAEPALSKA